MLRTPLVFLLWISLAASSVTHAAEAPGGIFSDEYLSTGTRGEPRPRAHFYRLEQRAPLALSRVCDSAPRKCATRSWPLAASSISSEGGPTLNYLHITAGGFAVNQLYTIGQAPTFYQPRRSVFLPVVRNFRPDVLNLFDVKSEHDAGSIRNETTVASQSPSLTQNLTSGAPALRGATPPLLDHGQPIVGL